MYRLALILILLFAGARSEVSLANYASGLQYYRAGRLYESAAFFYQAMQLARSRAEKRASEWYLADSLERLRFPYSASKYYTLIVRRGYKEGNPYFRKALEALGRINNNLKLGQSQIVELFKTRVDPSVIPGAARGFYFYYLGVEQYSSGRYRSARRYFEKVPSGSSYGAGAEFHLGVIANLSGRHSEAIGYFNQVRRRVARSEYQQSLYEAATMNLARVYYEVRRFDKALSYYAEIPRNSDNWLEGIWEGAWAFFMMQKHNNVLGNIHTLHSPFYNNRFYPESYILRSITFLRLCRYDQAKNALKKFQKRYRDTLKTSKAMMRSYRGRSASFFRMIYDYRTGRLDRFSGAFEILDKVMRSDPYKEGADTNRFTEVELARLNREGNRWRASGLQSELRQFLNAKKRAASEDAGRRLYQLADGYVDYLRDLDNQSGLVLSEILLENINKLRKQINIEAAKSRVKFGGGMKPLNLGAEQEYWPFIPAEYWEDELGYYVYNIDSVCGKKKR